LYIGVEHAAALWQALVAAGAGHGLVPAGLASRDTLRLEAGMPLYGHELGLDTFPAQAGLGRVVALGKEGDFVGRAASEAGPVAGARVLKGLVTEGRRAGRADYLVFSGDTEVGIITSGALSPTLGHPIAMAYIDPDADEATLTIDVRGTRIPASVVPLPFYKREN
jgi:aminomethyltransferase